MKKLIKPYLPSFIFGIFLVASLFLGYQPGIDIMNNFFKFFVNMMKFIPAVFMLLGLFEVWANRAIIEKHLGEESGIKGYLWAMILAITLVGGLHVAFPISYSIYKKGASIKIVLAYIGFATVIRVPMTLFELSSMGLKFTLVRLAISIPLVIIFVQLLSTYLNKQNYKMIDNKN